MDHCTILQKGQFLMTTKCWLNPVSLLRSICIWWLEENIFSRQKLNPVSLLRSVCIWWLVKLITSQFYKKDNFSWRRIRTLNPASASGDLLNWSLHNSTKETISHDEKMSTKSIVFTSQTLHLVISKIDHCTILQKGQFLRRRIRQLNPTSASGD